MEPYIRESLQTGFITTILGPRRVGKTSLVQHLLTKMPEAKRCELNLDQMRVRDRINNLELAQLIAENCQQNIGGSQKLWVAIDEAQKCPAIFEQLKIIYDEWKDTDKIKFILTGSAHLSLHQLSAETLAGRIEIYYLQPFTLREITNITTNDLSKHSLLNLINNTDPQRLPTAIEAEIKQISPYKPQLENNLNNLLIWGGLPELMPMQNDTAKQRYLDNYIDTYLEQDVRKIETITDLNLYKNLMNIVAQQTGSLRDDTKVLQVLGCGRDTLKKYLGYLQATLMYFEVFPYITAATTKLVKSPKAYMLDNGIISNLTGISDPQVLINTGAIGHRFENWFLQELHAWIAQFPVRGEINFLRLSSGAEVDFIVVNRPYTYPFEITFGTRPDRKKLNNLVNFLASDHKIGWAFYIYNGEFAVDTERKVIFIPAWSV